MAKKGKEQGGAIVNYEEELARRAAFFKESVSSIALGSFISIRGGVMQFQGNQLQDNQIECVILDGIITNLDYEKEFDPQKPAVPRCYAFGRDAKKMVPHEQSSDKQHPTCQGCWANEMSSADKGRGKHCKNQWRLGLISSSALREGIEAIDKAEVAFIQVPVMSVKGWAGHINKVGEVLKKPPFGVVSNIKCVPDQKSQYKLIFSIVSEIKDKGIMGALMKRSDEVSKGIMFPFPEIEDTPAPARKGREEPARGGKRGGVRKF